MDRFLHWYLFLNVLVISGCAHTSKGNYSLDNTVIEKYSEDYFIGVGAGTGNSKELAIKIAKMNAQAELAQTIKVTILSKAELVTSETIEGNTSNFSETFKQKIISLGDATVRSPQYEILNIQKSKDVYQAKVLVKKLKRQHIEEAARDLEFIDDADKLLDLLGK